MADSDDDDPRSHRSLRAWHVVSIVVVVAVASVLGWIVSRDDRPQAQVGAVLVAPVNTPVNGATTKVYVPWGHFRLTIGSPHEELPKLIRETKRAPDGGAFVGLSLVIGGTDSLRTLPFAKGGRYRRPHITLVADGRNYPVPELTRGLVSSGGSTLLIKQTVKVFVAIADMPAEISVTISYDGMTQTISSDGTVTPGRFAALQKTDTRTQPLSCGDPQRAEHQPVRDKRAVCTLTRVARLPYVAGLGWADRGHEWLVMLVEIEPPDVGIRMPSGDTDPIDDDYTVTEYRLGTKQPVSQVKANSTGPGLSFVDPDDPDQVIFTVPTDAHGLQLDITSTFRAHPHSPTIQVSWHVSVP